MLLKRPASRSGGELSHRRRQRAATLRGGGGWGGIKSEANPSKMSRGQLNVQMNNSNPHFDARGTKFKHSFKNNLSGQPLSINLDNHKAVKTRPQGGYSNTAR